jgi:hypothetical protein
VSRRLAAALAAAAAAFAFPLTASARANASAALARRGITQALRQHWIKSADASGYRADVYLAQRAVATLPPLRARIIEVQLGQVAAMSGSYISPRALALFSQLRENVDWLSSNRLPSGTVDVTGPDGVVYRWFPGQGLELHPLADFGALNNLVSAHDLDGTQLLADALLARAIPRNRSLLWEYSFRYGAGSPPWASGLAQAVAAQALARASVLLDDPSLLASARKAYLAVPGKLVLQLSTGPWIMLYGFNREIVLNAQLQAIVSLDAYASATGDTSAQELADQMDTAAQGLFSRFDTGDWSLYELGGAYASRSYEVYVTTLLGKLAKLTQDPFWQDAAARFVNYTYRPPQVTQPTPPPAVVAYPQPADGWLDALQIPVTLSKRASLTVAIAGKVLTWSKLGPGSHVLSWKPGAAVKPGSYPVTVRAVDFLGRYATFTLAPVTIAWDLSPPPFQAQVDTQTNVLTWQDAEPGTPWLHLQLELTDPTGAQLQQVVDLGRQPTSGTLQLTIPSGTWNAVVDATNSAGQTTKVTLPVLTGPPPP